MGSGDCARASPAGRSHSHRTKASRVARIGALALVVCLAFFALAALGAGVTGATPSTAGDDGVDVSKPIAPTEPGGTTESNATGNASTPVLERGEKLNATAVELLLVDDAGIDTETVEASDFLLSEGDVAGVAPSAEGTNATVELALDGAPAADEFTVGIAPESNIRSVDGARIEPGMVTVAGMDGTPPQVLSTNVSDARGGPAMLEFRFDQRVSNLSVSVTGPANETLEIDAFERADRNRYVAEYEPPEHGEYRVALEHVTGEANDTAELSIVRTMRAVDVPEAVVGVDLGATSGTNVTFDAGSSTGEALEYAWEFGDGETATGERVSHEFEPGEQAVVLEATDASGTTDTDALELNLTDGFDADSDLSRTNGPAVVVDRDGSGANETAFVSVTGASANETVEIGHDDDALVASEAVTLEELSVTPAAANFSIALSAVDADAVADAAGSNSQTFGGFTVVTDLAETAGVDFGVSVDAETLTATQVAPEDVELQREVDGEWESLETTVESDEAGRYLFRASSPGFSRFALVGVDGDSDGGNESEAGSGQGAENGSSEAANESSSDGAFEVTDASVNETEVTEGAAVSVNATVENRGETDEFSAGLTVGDEPVEVSEHQIASNGSETVEFVYTLEEPGSQTLAVNDTVAGEVTVTEAESTHVDEDEIAVTEVTLNETSVEPGDVVRVEATVQNDGEEMADALVELSVDGEAVDEMEVPQVPPDGDVPVFFEERFDEEGSYTISVDGTESDEELTVGDGGLFGFLETLWLLPGGLVRTALGFLGIPVLVAYLALKSAAFYLGY